MSVDFWESSQWKRMAAYQQQPVPEKRSAAAVEQDIRVLSTDEIRAIQVWAVQKIFSCCEKLKVSVRVGATASTYLKRFYKKRPLSTSNPLLYAPACILLASKVEESFEWPQSILHQWRRLIGSSSSHKEERWADSKDAIIEAECEILIELNYSLIVHHPYRPLELFLKDAAADGCSTNAWTLVNDSFLFDVGSHHAPHIIALACLHMASVMVGGKDLQQWFLNVMDSTTDRHTEVSQVMQDMMKGYDLLGLEGGERQKRLSGEAMAKIVEQTRRSATGTTLARTDSEV